MAEFCIASNAMDILTLLLGSALTILGGFLSNRQSSKLSREAERRKIRRMKLEKLASLTLSAEDWIDKMEENIFANPPRYTPLEPMDQMMMLSNLYFPEIRGQVDEFCITARELCQRIREEGMRRLRVKSASIQNAEGGLAESLQQFVVERVSIYKRMLEKQNAVIEALRNIVQKLDA